ncbi:hypothetical protein AZE42_10202 [Rhizopogon vesiculosus]|uniref:Uncharacterized protein n=1 Tax=Rhizopogon vesiculosus TaxID=180088 RepID=A0A1J8Q296_9AGAM|nr:hypothetical protein AZE42_10202 [Rhizopogon vesiculosus]
MFLSCSKIDSRIPESAMGKGPSGPEVVFSDTALAAFQRIAQPLFDPFQPGTYIHENQQLQALERQIVKITTEHDTILAVRLLAQLLHVTLICQQCSPSYPSWDHLQLHPPF